MPKSKRSRNFDSLYLFYAVVGTALGYSTPKISKLLINDKSISAQINRYCWIAIFLLLGEEIPRLKSMFSSIRSVKKILAKTEFSSTKVSKFVVSETNKRLLLNLLNTSVASFLKIEEVTPEALEIFFNMMKAQIGHNKGPRYPPWEP